MCVCVFTSQQTHTAQKQININIRLFASHARPQVIQDFWQSVNNLPSNGGEILMMCWRAWVSAQNWRRANISQSTRQFIIQPDIQTATEVSQHTGQNRILTLDYFECFFTCLPASASNTHLSTWKEMKPHTSVFMRMWLNKRRLTQRFTLKSTSNLEGEVAQANRTDIYFYIYFTEFMFIMIINFPV